MNARLVTLTVAFVLAIAAMIYLRRTAASLASSIGTESSATAATLSKTERIDHDHHPDRLNGLGPSQHQLVIRLEKLNLRWERN